MRRGADARRRRAPWRDSASTRRAARCAESATSRAPRAEAPFRAGPGRGVRRTDAARGPARARRGGRRTIGARGTVERGAQDARRSTAAACGPAGWWPPTACTRRCAARSAWTGRRRAARAVRAAAPLPRRAVDGPRRGALVAGGGGVRDAGRPTTSSASRCSTAAPRLATTSTWPASPSCASGWPGPAGGPGARRRARSASGARPRRRPGAARRRRGRLRRRAHRRGHRGRPRLRPALVDCLRPGAPQATRPPGTWPAGATDCSPRRCSPRPRRRRCAGPLCRPAPGRHGFFGLSWASSRGKWRGWSSRLTVGTPIA